MMRIAEALEAFRPHRGNAIVVPGRGGRYWTELTQHQNLDAPLGDPAMGGHAGFGLGLALARPERKCVLFDSEGDILMSLGMLATIAEQAPANFYHFLLDNEVYATTGGQPVPNAKKIAYDKLALAAGYKGAHAFEDIADLTRDLPGILVQPGPVVRLVEGLLRGRKRADRPASPLADPHARPGARGSAWRAGSRFVKANGAAVDAGTFDYIVTGAGSAGCCVAARLSENGRYKVLLLEAGPDDRFFWVHVPAGYSRLFANPRVNWMFESEPEPELEGRTMYQPRGKLLGGTSSINGMVYMRGNQADYDLWRQRGCTGWDWDSVLPYFKKAEDQERGASAAHGTGGPLRVSDQSIHWELGDHFIAAAMQAGLPARNDFNDGDQEGAGPFQNTTNRKRRWSTATAYLKPARQRSNLTIRTDSQATRLVIENGRAGGIEFVCRGALHVAHATGEIIVCGGVYGSPQLLQLSGLGPGDMLQRFGVPVVRDMPGVGTDLQDHFYVRLAFRCTQPMTLNDIANSPVKKLLAGMQYVFFETGPLSSNGICAGGFAKSDPRLDRPDIQFNFSVWSFAERTNRGVVPHPHPGFTISAVHLRPDARGSVALKSPDPLAAPSIRFNFLRTRYDIEALTAGMRLARRITQQPALKPYVAAELIPGREVESDADFEATIRKNGISNLHPVGTCRMGADPAAVCDPRLRVNGIGGLRVVDASVMPSVPAGNTNAPTIMIAEKASAMILEDARAA